jgi:tRNA(Ile)-lysidine synthase
MHQFVRNLLTEWRRLDLPFGGETFVAAVSGGADSVSLLLALEDLRQRKKLDNRVIIAHFNHNLRGDQSAADAEFVLSLCEKFDFEFASKIRNSHSDIRDQSGNLEQNARFARYEFLRETAENLRASGVLTAHTINDQAETFLINLLRGSGLRGLSGMKAIREMDAETREPASSNAKQSAADESEFQDQKSAIQISKSKIRLIRPLLNWARRIDTENFCRAREIEPHYDSMNEDLAFQRVRIRKVLLPMLADFNPKIVETLANTANLLRGENENAERRQKDKKEGDIDWSAGEISLKELKILPTAELYGILRRWIEANRGDLRRLETKHLAAIERLIFSRKSGRVVELPNGASVVKESGKLAFKNFRG